MIRMEPAFTQAQGSDIDPRLTEANRLGLRVCAKLRRLFGEPLNYGPIVGGGSR
jgi:hypothetical protein